MKKLYPQGLALFLMLFVTSVVYAQCPAVCDFTEADGPFINLNGNQTLCITSNSSVSVNTNGSNNVICVAPGVTWTQGSANLQNTTVNVYGTWDNTGVAFGGINATGAGNVTVHVQSGGVLNTDGTGFGNGITMINDGEINFISTSTINFSGSFNMTNNAGGSVNAPSTLELFLGTNVVWDNYGDMHVANIENEEAFLNIYAGSYMLIDRAFDNHGAFIVEAGAIFELPCNPLPGAAGTTVCSFRVGDKGVGKEFINNSCCFSVNGNVQFDGATTNNGYITITNGDLNIVKPSNGTNGHISLTNGTSTITNSGSYAGTNLTFCDSDTPGGDFDAINNPPASNMYTVDCSLTNCCGATGTCTIDADGLMNVVCGGTDAISLDLTPTGTGVSATYTVSVSGGGATSISPTSGTYGSATTFTLNDNSAGGGDVTVTITDANGCMRDVLVTDPGVCFCGEMVEAGDGQTICSTSDVNLSSLGASITPMDLGGTWSTSGSGTFDDTNMSTGVFGTATTYTPSAADIAAGEIVLQLTITDTAVPGCTGLSDEVTIMIQQVDCGTFPWNGND